MDGPEGRGFVQGTSNINVPCDQWDLDVAISK